MLEGLSRREFLGYVALSVWPNLSSEQDNITHQGYIAPILHTQPDSTAPKKGPRIFFTEGKGDKSEVWAMDGDGQNLDQITKNSYEEIGPAVSLDGRYLAYVQDKKDVRLSYLHIQNLLSGAKAMYECKDDRLSVISWGSNRRLAVQREPFGPADRLFSGFFLFDFDPEKGEISKKDSVSGLTQSNVSFSPDGNFVAYDSDAGGQINDLRNMPKWYDPRYERMPNVRNPIWSPRGDKILFISDRADKNHYLLYLMDADGKNQRVLSSDDFNTSLSVLNPGRWSPDGSKVAYIHQDLCIVDADTLKKVHIPLNPFEQGSSGYAHIIDNDAKQNPYYLHWSPDGDALIYRAQVLSPDEMPLCAFRVNADGKGFKMLRKGIDNVIAYR